MPLSFKKKLIDFKNLLKSKIFFLAIGRLTIQKNFIFLIECFSELIKKNNLINLVIIGDGPDMERLKNLVRGKGLNERCMFFGYKKNAYLFLEYIFINYCIIFIDWIYFLCSHKK